MNNPPDFIHQFDGQFEDGLSISESLCTAAPPLRKYRRRTREGVSVGERVTLHRPVSDG